MFVKLFLDDDGDDPLAEEQREPHTASRLGAIGHGWLSGPPPATVVTGRGSDPPG